MTRRLVGGVGLAVLCLGAPAWAFDELRFVVRGGNEDLERTLRNASLLVAAQNEDVTDATELLAAARADYARLVGALYSTGRYGPVIHIYIDGQEAAALSPLTRLQQIDTITVDVQPGPVYPFSQTELGPLAPETEIPDGFTVGEPAESGTIRDAAQSAVLAWREVGHAKAEVGDQQVVAQHEENQLAADIDIAPGPLVRFGDLILTGSEAVRPERLRAIAGFPAGEIYSPDKLDDVTRRIRRTQVFSTVALTEAETLTPNDRLDVEANLVAFPPRRIGFGAEVSTVDGLTLSGFWLHRNLLGGAERLRLDGEISGLGGGTGGRDYELGARFERPATFAPENTFFAEAAVARLNEEDYTSDAGELTFGIHRYVNEEIEIEYGLGYRFSRVEDESGTTDYSMLIAPLSATFDNRENPLNATDGFFLDTTLTPFLGTNDQTGTGARLTWDGRSYLGFGEDDRFVLAGRLQGGSIIGAELEAVPNEYRFYSGGGGTVRGHEYQSLGVELDSGIRSGGASYVVASAEVRAGLTEKIGLVGFYDYGTVGYDAFPDGERSHAGAGLGLRYQTPVGPIRLDVATPVSSFDDEDDESSFQVYVGIGQAF
ncbi:autotransporter secretion outer membrane protein TamA [Palleronia marisminoris]|uniref:Translocation and assembly module TamA n=1 Tax=Palleronia marisminoris TaxID=315423 RepID=A0A1Y5SXI2_9RHOB|nr:autotransporter assembly complex family protein [Palleronia marisminoris]SFH04626.1 autotransporter secretion outer membrane protein TamA [Palleronia marisminoris]SLN50388.1 Translocation and assembly module TamA precursor [Palleronia marisminoris]